MKFDLENPSVKKPGGICLDHVKFEVVPNFIDYLKSGLEINMISAIDFTGKFTSLFRLQWYSLILEFPSLLEQSTHTISTSVEINLEHHFMLRF